MDPVLTIPMGNESEDDMMCSGCCKSITCSNGAAHKKHEDDSHHQGETSGSSLFVRGGSTSQIFSGTKSEHVEYDHKPEVTVVIHTAVNTLICSFCRGSSAYHHRVKFQGSHTVSS